MPSAKPTFPYTPVQGKFAGRTFADEGELKAAEAEYRLAGGAPVKRGRGKKRPSVRFFSRKPAAASADELPAGLAEPPTYTPSKWAKDFEADLRDGNEGLAIFWPEDALTERELDRTVQTLDKARDRMPWLKAWLDKAALGGGVLSLVALGLSLALPRLARHGVLQKLTGNQHQPTPAEEAAAADYRRRGTQPATVDEWNAAVAAYQQDIDRRAQASQNGASQQPAGIF